MIHYDSLRVTMSELHTPKGRENVWYGNQLEVATAGKDGSVFVLNVTWRRESPGDNFWDPT